MKPLNFYFYEFLIFMKYTIFTPQLYKIQKLYLCNDINVDCTIVIIILFYVIFLFLQYIYTPWAMVYKYTYSIMIL